MTGPLCWTRMSAIDSQKQDQSGDWSDQDTDDERASEIEALQAIYPELILEKHDESLFKGRFDIAVNLLKPITLVCQDLTLAPGNQEIYCVVNHLPPITLEFQLPHGYPRTKPPIITLTSSWLAPHRTAGLIPSLLKLWDDSRDQILYAMIDSLFQQAETGFGVSRGGGAVVLDMTHNKQLRDTLLAYDVQSSQKDFEAQTFKCAICQYPKRGKVCTQLTDCRHVFCTDCLSGYLEALITQGYIAQVKCPDMSCTKADTIAAQDLKALVGETLCKRYYELQKKKELEGDPNTIICPRSTCQALIRPPAGTEILCVCASCLYAFCRSCKKSWHGYYTECVFKTEVPERDLISYMTGRFEQRRDLEMVYGRVFLTKEVSKYLADEAFKVYVDTFLKSCPHCAAPIERSMGCNKMRCEICMCKFCYLCGENLDGYMNAYDHYSESGSDCFGKLFNGTEIEAAAAAGAWCSSLASPVYWSANVCYVVRMALAILSLSWLRAEVRPLQK